MTYNYKADIKEIQTIAFDAVHYRNNKPRTYRQLLDELGINEAG